ncbi:PelD GGDEF domain-containing protein [Jeongeupia chitinilytica]|uniref:Pellicle/biofilm biosynthesis protein PelD n=1 Tax=Jeongeupia chitinilytica TaxID=1041641 RepID=A0ABQ3H0C8_9NEIS|nr:PelD GGDEF domain-containing protein [Jeongeupia chitinilytica]GHD64121.1 pellicle/biofilm biosynthesis protein PelD [Jeongeupia chitinilytica]
MLKLANWQAHLAQARRPGWHWAEALGMPALGLATGFWLSPADPFGVGAPFPWQWLVPLLVALRYGMLPGLAAAGVLLLGWLLLLRGQPVPPAYFIGGLIMTMIAGEYSGIWRTRVRRVEELNRYIDERLDRLARQHHLLRLSHERLEQNLISRPVTLRDALARLRGLLDEHTGQGSLPVGQSFLDFMAQFCQLEAAALFEWRNGELVEDPVALIGNDADYDRDDALLRYAVSHRTLCHVQTDALQHAETGLLVAVPLRNSIGAQIGVLAIKRMPFFALNDDTLQMISVLSAYYAEQVSVHELAAPLLEALPDCPASFAYEVFNLQRVQRESSLTSTIVIQFFRNNAQQHDIFNAVLRSQRGLDQVWAIEDHPTRALITLMPLSTVKVVDGYLARIENLVQERFGKTPAQAGISHHSVSLAKPDAWIQLQGLLRENRSLDPAPRVAA